MTGRNDITGYTLAEVALLLLFAIVAIFLPKYSKLTAELRAEAARNQGSVSASDADKMRAEMLALKEKLAQIRPGESAAGLRSRQTPSCVEKKVASGPIFVAVALPSGKYLVGGEALTANEIRSRFASEIAVGEENECRQRIQLGYTSGMSADQYYEAQVQMENMFYVGKVAHR